MVTVNLTSTKLAKGPFALVFNFRTFLFIECVISYNWSIISNLKKFNSVLELSYTLIWFSLQNFFMPTKELLEYGYLLSWDQIRCKIMVVRLCWANHPRRENCQFAFLPGFEHKLLVLDWLYVFYILIAF